MGGETGSRVADTSYPKLAEGPVAKRIHNIYKERLRQFTDGGQYSGNNLQAKLYEGRASGEPAVKLSVYSPPDLSRPSFKKATSHKFKPTHVGESFGPSWSTHWFKVQLRVPEELRSKKRLEFHWNANNEGLVYSEDGVPLQGLTGGGEREQWILPDSFRDGKEHTFYVEMACNRMFGNFPDGDIIQPPIPDRYYTLQKADIVAVNLDARALWMDFWIMGDCAREFPQDSWQEHQALTVANDIMDHFIAKNGSDESIRECREIAQKYLGDKIDSAKIYDDDSDVLVNGIGYCHIDTCWLWPWAETNRKVARSWASQCDLLDRYPEYRFCCSQPQQYKWLKMHYPPLFERVKEKVKEGTFQPIGGSWVEHDTNLPSGESLVRQFIYGQRFFESNFGERSKTFLLPDTFGYSSQLPQLCRLAGMTRFLTQKLSWNNINNFPHTTFNWVALDGSQVICHMPPCETYTAEANFGDVKRSITQHKSMDQDATSLLVFGKGDGGGGPTWEHLEKLRRCRGASDNISLLPRMQMGNSIDDFFARLEKKVSEGTELVTWYGELYFELHRGTYTTQAKNKLYNRKAEILLHDIEFLATMASIQDLVKDVKSSYRYPKKEIDFMWEAVLLCQFHDCLPGSSIEMCYDDSDELYEKVFKTGQKLVQDALDALGFKPATSGDGQLVAVNTSPWRRTGTVKLGDLPGHQKYGLLDGQLGVSQILEMFSVTKPLVSIKETEQGTYELENGEYIVRVSSGVVTSVYDKRVDREVIPKGAKANQFVIYDDKPLYWQAWDVEVYHLASRQELRPTKTSILENGPHRVSLLSETRISDNSSIKTTITLNAPQSEISPSAPSTYPFTPDPIEFSAEIDWHEDKKFLKVEFPLAVHTTLATHETQYGLVQRPTHYNTSWDAAKFEVCAHRFSDLSEAGYGVSLLNDSKYGVAAQGSVLRLSLLRAPKAPDAHADMGLHRVRWALLPHPGPLDGRTLRAAAAFNNPIVPAAGPPAAGAPDAVFPFFAPGAGWLRTHPAPDAARSLLGAIRLADGADEALVLDVVKRGEDDDDVRTADNALPARLARRERSIVLRLYDGLGGRCRGRVCFGAVPVREVRRCNLLEDEEGEVEIVEDGEGERGFRVELRAFEVRTYKLLL